MNTTYNTEFLKNTAALMLTIRAMGNTKKVRVEEIKADASDDLRKRVKGSKKLFISPELEAVLSYQNEVKAWIKTVTMPFMGFKGGIYLAKKDLVQMIEAELPNRVERMNELVAAFLAVYDQRLDESAKALQSDGLFNPKDYAPKSLVAKLFSINWNWVEFRVPEGLPAELRQAEELKLQSKFAEAEQEITLALREAFKQLLDHATDKLKVDPTDNKPKVFRDSLIENVVEFIDTFQARNLTNDTELETLVTRAKQIVSGVKPDDLRKDMSYRDRTLKKFDEVKQELDKMIVSMPARKFNFEEE